MGNQIDEALTNLGSSLVNATRPPPKLQLEGTNNGPFLEAIARATNTSTWNLTNQVESLPALVPNLDLISTTLGEAAVTGRRVHQRALSHGPEAVAASPGDAPRLAFRLWGSGKAAKLELEYRGTNAHLVARSDLGRIVEPIVDRQEFDEVLLLDAQSTNGVVLFQLGASALQASWLQVPADRSFQTNVVNFAGAAYLLFSQPLQLTPANPAAAPRRNPGLDPLRAGPGGSLRGSNPVVCGTRCSCCSPSWRCCWS